MLTLIIWTAIIGTAAAVVVWSLLTVLVLWSVFQCVRARWDS